MHIVYPGFLERVSHVSFMSGLSTFSAQSCDVTSSNATDTDSDVAILCRTHGDTDTTHLQRWFDESPPDEKISG
jgi:hypothetical protein